MSGDGAWETVVGLEVHVELATRTKLFCSCPNEFGAEPNTHVCPVCLGLPGSLPVLNERVVEFALRVGEAFGFSVPETSIFARKNYFYPDMPKDYQISQYDQPILVDGRLELGGGGDGADGGGGGADGGGGSVVIGIERAHLEEDTGKTTHVGGGGRIHEASHSLVDYNRAGVPLMEIVSRPDIRSADQARAYVQELRTTLEAIGVSDVKMEEGSLRVDANVSMRPAGSSELGTKVEIKNMNSLRSLVRALEHEQERQVALLEAGERVVQETRHWNEDDGRTHGMRSKEEAFDYRYFPEPDLVPVRPDAGWRERVRAAMPELPAVRRGRYITEWGAAEDDARTLLATPGLADWAEAAVAAGADPRAVVNWATGEVLAHLNEIGGGAGDLRLTPEHLAELVSLVDDGTLSRNLAREVLDTVLIEGGSPRAIVEQRGLAQVSDESELAGLVEGVLSAHSAEVGEYATADDKRRKKLRGFLMGQLMKEAQGKANPQVLNRLLDDRLA